MTSKQKSNGTLRPRSLRRKTSLAVKVSNLSARALVTIGGIGTIAAVLLVCVFLVSVVIPLFLPPKNEYRGRLDTTMAQGSGELGINEYLTIGWIFSPEGHLKVIRLSDGKLIAVKKPFGDRVPTASTFSARDGAIIFGFEDGTIQQGSLGFTTSFLEARDLPESLLALPPSGSADYEDGIIERISEEQFRLQKVAFTLSDPVTIEEGARILLLDLSMKGTGPVIAALTSTGTLHVDEISSRKNLLTGKVLVEISGGKKQIIDLTQAGQPDWLILSGLGDNAFLVWRDGRLIRIDTRDTSDMKEIEAIDIIPEPEALITSFTALIGKTSVVSGDSLGRVRVWFRVKPDTASTLDGSHLVLARELEAGRSAVTALKASARTRMLAAGFADGSARLYHVTSNRLLSDLTGKSDGKEKAVSAIAISPKDDAVLALGYRSIDFWRIIAPHPESTAAAIFTPIWYEGYNRPAHVWQSSSGTDDFEPKYGLIPLIFGTIKATFYAMLFGAPLGLLASLYTSELMNPKLRGGIKTLIEMMASLPSVVLGFLAAIIVAPFVEKVVPETLCAFFTIPFCILLGAHLWQLLPKEISGQWAGARWIGISLMIASGLVIAYFLGPAIETILFDGDIMAWLSGHGSDASGGWLFATIPFATCLVIYLFSRKLSPFFLALSRRLSPTRMAALNMLRFLIGTALVLGIAFIGARLLGEGPGHLWSFDARGLFLGTYVQRNSLIVGFIMGFAIIPIIFTISEDALSAVPNHLRSASLAAGATPWQTAMRIIIPTAASGLFSALMIGFGRAVGETMIVLMAAGNTPLMDWNIFNGFRTLSANIAVELPEAVKDSTHFRMLFLAALVLFVMTFFINTLAESVRQRFRKRAYEL